VTELIGWASSVVLLLTITKQVHTQWKTATSEGVSRWLYVGQIAASAGFTAYSALVRNWVFVVTNAALLVSALVGCAIYFRARRRESAG
jgi:MtN3 and saliva related transmembrane protein